MWDPSCVCNLHHSLWQCWILNPLSEARDRTCIFMDTSQIHYRWTTTGTPEGKFLSDLPFCLWGLLGGSGTGVLGDLTGPVTHRLDHSGASWLASLLHMAARTIFSKWEGSMLSPSWTPDGTFLWPPEPHESCAPALRTSAWPSSPGHTQPQLSWSSVPTHNHTFLLGPLLLLFLPGGVLCSPVFTWPFLFPGMSLPVWCSWLSMGYLLRKLLHHHLVYSWQHLPLSHSSSHHSPLLSSLSSFLMSVPLWNVSLTARALLTLFSGVSLTPTLVLSA